MMSTSADQWPASLRQRYRASSDRAIAASECQMHFSHHLTAIQSYRAVSFVIERAEDAGAKEFVRKMLDASEAQAPSVAMNSDIQV